MKRKSLFSRFAIIAISIIFAAGFAYTQSEGPTDLHASAVGNAVTLNWNAPKSGDVSLYNIYKATTTSSKDSVDYKNLDFAKVDSTNSTSFQDNVNSIGRNNTFIYYVTAVHADHSESEPSNYAKVTISGQ